MYSQQTMYKMVMTCYKHLFHVYLTPLLSKDDCTLFINNLMWSDLE